LLVLASVGLLVLASVGLLVLASVGLLVLASVLQSVPLIRLSRFFSLAYD
jgi:hypothetical protein